MVLGGVSKIIAAGLTYPYQVVKSRLQQRAYASDTAYTTSKNTSSSSNFPASNQGSATFPSIHLSENSVALMNERREEERKKYPKYRGTWHCMKKIWRFYYFSLLSFIAN
jgi:hypothetical protein